MRKGDDLKTSLRAVIADLRDKDRAMERAATQETIPAGSGTGTVTSVALTMPAIFSVAGSPIVAAGTLAVTLASQSANQVLAGPTSGGAAAPTFRTMVAADIPSSIITYAKIQNMTTARLLGRTTAGSGVVEEISVGSGLTLAAGVLDTAGGGSITGSGTNAYLAKWTGASSIGDSLYYAAGGDILTIAQAGGVMSAPLSVDARMEITADAVTGYGATAVLLAVDRDGGGIIVHRAGLSSDSLTETTKVYGHLTWNTDATYDIGASGATRPRDAYLSRSLYAASIKLLGSSSGTATITPPAAAGTPALTLPTSTGTLALTADITTAVNAAVSGTTSKIAKFTAANVVGNSIMTESGAKIEITGALTAIGQSDTNQLVVKGHSTQTSAQIVIQSSAGVEWLPIRALANGSFVIGKGAAPSLTSADTIAIGNRALEAATTSSSIAIGDRVLKAMTSSGHTNVGFGRDALQALTSGLYNFAFGINALYNAGTQISCIAVGIEALYNITGSSNVGIGNWAGYYATSGAESTYIGDNAGMRCNGTGVVVIGDQACYPTATTSISYSTYIGWRSGKGGSAQGSYNTAIGAASLQKNVSNAVAIGYQAGNVQTGAGFTGVGYQAGLLSTSGANSTLIGSGAGASLTTNGGCVMLGYQAGGSETAANKLYIHNSNSATPLIYGDFSTPSLTFNGTVNIQDAKNIVLGSTTGNQVATATTQKLSFHGSTPVIQRAGAAQAAVATTAATNSSPYGYTTAAQADAIVALVNEIRAALVEKGLIKGAA